jgi:hypothetical protein
MQPRGQSMVEFAAVLPIFIMLLVGIFDFGRVIWINDTLAAAAREAARYAIVHGGSASTACPAGPPGPDSLAPAPTCPPFPNGTAYPIGSKEAIRDVAHLWASGTSNDVTVSICYGVVTVCAGDADAAGATNARGTPVTVTVTAAVNLAAPALFGFGPFDLSATSTMLVNH